MAKFIGINRYNLKYGGYVVFERKEIKAIITLYSHATIIYLMDGNKFILDKKYEPQLLQEFKEWYDEK